MKVKLIISILAVTFLNGIIASNIINFYKSKNKFPCKDYYCKYGDEIFNIKLLDLKTSEIELNKKLFNSYSTTYSRFDGESYEDICLDLIKTQIPNKDISDFMGFYSHNEEFDGVIKEQEIFYDTYKGIREIPISNVMKT